MIVDRAHDHITSQATTSGAAAASADDRDGGSAARPRLSRLESIVLREIKQCLLQSADLLDDNAPLSQAAAQGAAHAVERAAVVYLPAGG